MALNNDFDFDRSVEQAWRRFGLRLANVLSMMDETEPLTLDPNVTDEWILRFCQESPSRVTAEVLPTPGGAALSSAEGALLESLGWQKTESGCRVCGDQDDCEALARVAVQAMREVFLIQHPVFLDSNVLSEILQEPGVSEEEDPSRDTNLLYSGLDDIQLSAAVAEELSEIVSGAVLRDQDGDFAVRAGSTMIFIRVPTDAKEIRLFSVLVHDIAGRSRAVEVLNDVNAHARWGRFYLVRDKIFLTMSILASPFVPAHLRQAVTEMMTIADGVDDLLAASLQGKTTFPDHE